MERESLRQLVHISGVVFVVMAQISGKFIASFYFLFIAFTFFSYSQIILKERRRVDSILAKLEKSVRDATLSLERKDVKRPFSGAMWFYFSCGITFLIFPLEIASAACVMLAIGDGFSTLIGRKGRVKILGKKTLEGTTSMFVSSFLAASFFVSPVTALTGSIMATISEIMPEYLKLKKKRIIDDNLLIPLVSAAAMYILSIA